MQVFKLAKVMQPSIIYIDEVEKVHSPLGLFQGKPN